MYHNQSTFLTACMLFTSTFCLVIVSSVAPIKWAFAYGALATSLATYGIHKIYE